MNYVFPECKSWVFKPSSKECFLKNKYDNNKKIPCADCIAYDESSRSYVYQTHATVTKKIVTISSGWTMHTFGGGGWAKATGSESCRFTIGKDQAKEYNIHSKPLYRKTPFACCNACGKNPRKRPPVQSFAIQFSMVLECKSWVWRSTHGSCYLKNAYDESKMSSCDDCVGYSEGGGYYLTEKYSTSAGGGGGGSAGRTVEKDLSWSSETGIWMPKDHAAKLCKVSKGYDQPAEYNIHSEPLKLKFSFQCCNECAKENGTYLFTLLLLVFNI